MLSPMAKGIQTLHSTVELFNKYSGPSEVAEGKLKSFEEMLYDWSQNHKTCISLNGGTSPDLKDLKIFFAGNIDNPYPWAEFYEDESLGYLMTAISIVLPEKIYETASLMREYRTFSFRDDGMIGAFDPENMSEEEFEAFKLIDSFGKFSRFEQELIQKIGEYRLAS